MALAEIGVSLLAKAANLLAIIPLAEANGNELYRLQIS